MENCKIPTICCHLITLNKQKVVLSANWCPVYLKIGLEVASSEHLKLLGHVGMWVPLCLRHTRERLQLKVIHSWNCVSVPSPNHPGLNLSVLRYDLQKFHFFFRYVLTELHFPVCNTELSPCITSWQPQCWPVISCWRSTLCAHPRAKTFRTLPVTSPRSS